MGGPHDVKLLSSFRSVMGNDQQNVSSTYNMREITQRRENNLTLTFSLIFLSFIICFLPYTILDVFDPVPPSRYQNNTTTTTVI